MPMSSQYIFTMHRLSKLHPPDKTVLDNLTLAFYPGAKIGVLGYNGAGKSTLLRIMAGVDQEYRGEAALAPGATVGMLEQEPHLDESKDVRGNVEDGVAETKALLDRFNELAANYSEETAEEFGNIQAKIDAADAWNLDTQLEYAMDALRLPPADASREHPLRRRAPPRGPLPAAAARTGPAAARRAHEPSRRRVCGVARAAPGRVQGHDRRPSPTIATSWTTSPAGSSSSTAAKGSPTRATTRPGSSRSRNAWPRKIASKRLASARSRPSSNGSAPTPRANAQSQRRASRAMRSSCRRSAT